MKKVLGFLSRLFGFEKLTKYENEYLHASNLRSSIYMGFIVAMLEIWMLIRQTYAKFVPKVQAGGEWFPLFVKYTSKYWLFLLIGVAVMLFCMFRNRDKTLSKGKFIALATSGAACVLYTAELGLETFMQPSESVTPVMANIMNAMLVTVYVLLFVIGAAILVAGRNRIPLVTAGVLFLSLAFGQMLIGGHTTVADIAIHLALTVVALILVEEDKK